MSEIPDSITHLRKLLLQKQKDILSQLKAGESAAQTVELDQTRQGRLSRMDAMQQQAMAKATVQRRELELKKISAALLRMDSADYGLCKDCGDEIPSARLEINPGATFCVSCAEKQT